MKQERRRKVTNVVAEERVWKVYDFILKGYNSAEIRRITTSSTNPAELAKQQKAGLCWDLGERQIERYMTAAYKVYNQQSEERKAARSPVIESKLLKIYNKTFNAQDYKTAIKALEVYMKLHGLGSETVKVENPVQDELMKVFQDSPEKLLEVLRKGEAK